MIFWSVSHGFDVETAASAALQWLFKATVVLLIALLLDRLLRGRFVLTCAAVWNATLLLLAALPIAALLLPIWTFAVTTPAEIAVVEAVAPSSPPQDLQPIAPIVVQPAPIEQVAFNHVEPPPATLPVSAMPAAESPKPSAPAQTFHFADFVGPNLTAIYLLGVGFALWQLFRSMRSVTRLRRSSQAVNDPRWQRALTHWRERCGLRQEIELRQSDSVEVPLLLGWRRPLILLPTEVAANSDERTREAVLIHELAHVARGDFAWQLFLRGVRAMLWFHPLMWWSQRRIGVVRERACDAYTIHRLGGSTDYIATLLDMAGRLTRRGSLSLGLAVLRTSQLGERLAAMRDGAESPCCQANKTVRVFALLTALLLAGWGGRVALGEPMLPRVEGLPSEAQTMVSQFETEATQLRKEADRQIAERRTRLEQSLKSLQDDFTRQAKLDEALAVREQLRLLKATAKFGDRLPTIYKDPGNMVNFRSLVGQTFYLSVTGSTSYGNIWGTDAYTDDSTLAVAAVHAGVLKPNQTGIVKVTMLPPRPMYDGSQRNGVSSGNYTNNVASSNPPIPQGMGAPYSTYTIERAPDEIIALGKSVAAVEMPATPIYTSNTFRRQPGGLLVMDLKTGDAAITDQRAATVAPPLPTASAEIPAYLKLELRQAEIQVQTAKANLQTAHVAVQRAEANLSRCAADREFREKRYQRLAALHKQQAIDQDTIDESHYQLKAAQAAEDLARIDHNAAKAQAAAAAEQLSLAEEELKEVQAKIEVLRKQRVISFTEPPSTLPPASDSVISKALNFVGRFEALAPPPPTVVLQAPRNLTAFRQNIGQSFLFYLPSAAAPLSITQHINGATGETTTSYDGSVWGTDIYTDDSALDVAAVHAGLLHPKSPTIVRVTILPGQTNYESSTRHGVTSSSYHVWNGSYRIEKPTAEDYRRINEIHRESIWLDLGNRTNANVELVTLVDPQAGPSRRTMSQRPVQREFTPFEDFIGRLVTVDRLPADRRPAKSIAVHFKVDERSYRRYQELLRTGKVKGLGDPLAVALSDEQSFPRQGTLDHFESEFDPNTGTIGAYAVVSNPDGLLLPGMHVNVRMNFGPPSSVLEIPADSVQHGQNESYVWVVTDGNIVQRRLVQLGAMDDEGRMRIIADGLTLEDLVVVEGTNTLKPGDNIGPPPTDPNQRKGNP